MAITRRELLSQLALQGACLYTAMTGLGLLAQPSAHASGPLRLEGRGDGRRVLILGGGLAGLAAAYELGKLGYRCRILEARERPGGRSWTIRGGDRFREVDGTEQHCRFDPGHYLNPGPARIPQWHVTLDYCKELGVAVEPFAMRNESAYYHHQGGPLGGRPIQARALRADMRGYLAEALAKAVHLDELELPLSAEDRDRLIEFLRDDGDLDPDLVYRGSTRRGYRVDPAAGEQAGTRDDPFGFGELLRSGLARYLNVDNTYFWQMMMFQPVGGMDQIARALARRLDPEVITYGAEVLALRRTERGVSVPYRKADREQLAEAELCICTLPLSVLRGVPSDLSAPQKDSIAHIPYFNVGKCGLQFRRRFWEEDDRIFGGITHTDLPIAQILYPSHGYLGEKGVLVGYFNVAGPGIEALGFKPTAEEFGRLPPSRRLERAIAEGSLIHPQYPKEFENGVSVDWDRTPYSLGCTVEYTREIRRAYYPALLEPAGPIYLAGDHCSHLQGWQAGALESARQVVTAVHRRVLADPRRSHAEAA